WAGSKWLGLKGACALGLTAMMLLSCFCLFGWQSGPPLDRLDHSQIPALQVYPWQPKELVAVIGEHQWKHWQAVRCLVISPNGKMVASGGDDGAIRIWDPGTGRQQNVISSGTSVNALAISADGRTLVSGGAN